VSNIPGPAAPLYMLGCPLKATYPVVPLADRHALSVGMTTVRDLACFGVYADRETVPDADMLARDIDHAIAELLAGAVEERAAPLSRRSRGRCRGRACPRHRPRDRRAARRSR